MKVTQMPPVHAANLVANSGNAAYGVDVIGHDEVIKCKHFPRYWPFVQGSHRWIPLKKISDAELWCFSLICALVNGWVNNHETGDLTRHRAHYDVIVMGLVTSLFRRSILVLDRLLSPHLT